MPQGISAKTTGVSCSIPDNIYSHLMYYFQSVNSLIGITQHISNLARFTGDKYESEHELTFKEKLMLYRICKQLNPAWLNNKCLIRNASICGDSNNEFFRVTDADAQNVSLAEFNVAGNPVKVSGFMAYKDRWIENFYIEPMKQLQDEIEKTEMLQLLGMAVLARGDDERVNCPTT